AKLRSPHQQAAHASNLIYPLRKLENTIEWPSLPRRAAKWVDHNVRVVRIPQRFFAPSLKLNASLRIEIQPGRPFRGFNTQGPQSAETFIRPPASAIINNVSVRQQRLINACRGADRNRDPGSIK